MVLTTALLLASILPAVLGAGSQIAGGISSANAAKKQQENLNLQTNMNNALSQIQNEQSILNNTNFADMYNQKENAFKLGGRKGVRTDDNIEYFDRLEFMKRIGRR